MGVQNLWQLLLPVGRRINIETLEGKALAVDVSIWLIQFIRTMRDEEGKMVKNAHLIGTLRRILKLLFHRIKPVFVFDGGTPELKRRTVQHRRVLRERQEHNLKKAAEKILVAQLKQAALTARLKEVSVTQPQSQAQSGQYSSSFVSQNKDAAPPFSPGVAAAVDDDEDYDNVAWESAEETTTTRPKPLDEEGGASSDSEDAWFVPDNDQDIDVEALSALPAHIRKEMIMIARRRHRVQARADFVPVAENPAMYSQTQIANFLRTSRLNERIYEVQEKTRSMEPGQNIAASASRKFIIMKDDHLESDIEELDEQDQAILQIHEEVELQEITQTSAGAAPSQAPEITRADDNADGEVEDDDWATSGGGFFGDEVTSNVQQTNAQLSPVMIQPEVTPDPPLVAPSTTSQEASADIHRLSEPTSTTQAKLNPVEMSENDGVVDTEERSRLAKRKRRVQIVDISDQNNEYEDAMKRLRELATTSQQSTVATTTTTANGQPEKEATEVAAVHRKLMPEPVVDEEFRQPAETGQSAAIATAGQFDERNAEFVEPSKPDNAKEQVIVIRFERPIMAPPAVLPSKPASDDQDELQLPLESTPLGSKQGTVDVVNRAAPPMDKASAQSEPEHEPVQPPEHADDDEPANETEDVDRIHDELDQLEEEQDLLKQQKRTALRDTERMTEEMKEEVLEMLQALGLPYIVAPMEAEAQCAVLEALGVVDGVVTEDGDAFLFGAQTVYKNIFDERKYVEVFLASDAERELGISRNEFIALAYLLGSDYTPGVRGVGIVNAMEVLHAFPCKEDPIEGLKEFKEWLGGFNITEAMGLKGKHNDELDNTRKQFHMKHKGLRSRWQADDNFPDERVAKAYLRPQVNSDATKFEWPVPEIVRVRDYCRQRLGWTDADIDKTVVPAIANFAATQTQKRIDSYFMSYTDNIQFARIRSNRLRTAVGSITGQVPEPSSRLTSLPGKRVGGKRTSTLAEVAAMTAATETEEKRPKPRRQKKRRQAQSWEDLSSESASEEEEVAEQATASTRPRRKLKSK